jgi:hypothetical protein
MVYVDPLFVHESKDSRAKFVGTRTGHKWCHMWCDQGDEEKLHKIADKIGMKRIWFQDRPNFAHYDLVPSKRILAIKNGAVECSLYDWIRGGRKPIIVKKEESFFEL